MSDEPSCQGWSLPDKNRACRTQCNSVRPSSLPTLFLLVLKWSLRSQHLHMGVTVPMETSKLASAWCLVLKELQGCSRSGRKIPASTQLLAVKCLFLPRLNSTFQPGPIAGTSHALNAQTLSFTSITQAHLRALRCRLFKILPETNKKSTPEFPPWKPKMETLIFNSYWQIKWISNYSEFVNTVLIFIIILAGIDNQDNKFKQMENEEPQFLMTTLKKMPAVCHYPVAVACIHFHMCLNLLSPLSCLYWTLK